MNEKNLNEEKSVRTISSVFLVAGLITGFVLTFVGIVAQTSRYDSISPQWPMLSTGIIVLVGSVFVWCLLTMLVNISTTLKDK